MVSERPQDALALLRPVLERNPTDREARGYSAAACYLTADSSGYHREVKRLLDQDPGYMEVFLDLARILEQSRRNDEAIALYRRVLARDPENAEALTGLGLLAMREGNEEEARGFLERGFKGDAYNIRAFNQLELLDKMDTFAVFAGKHFTLRVDAGADTLLVPLLEERLNRIYDDLVPEHGWTPPVPTVVEVFPDHEWFSARVTGFPWLGGIPAVCFGHVVAMDSPRTLSGSSNWEQILRHEFGHVLALGMTDKKVPFWFTEGLSVHLEEYPRGLPWDQNLVAAYVDNELVPVDSLTLAFTRPRDFDQRLLAYHESGLIIDDLVARKGWKVIPALLRAFGDGKDLPEALREEVGESYEEFAAHAMEVVRAQAAALPVWPSASKERVTRLAARGGKASQDPRVLEQLGMSSIQIGEFGEAADIARSLLAHEPANVRARVMLGLAARQNGQPDSARTWLEDALAGGTRDIQAYMALAGLAVEARDTTGALARYAQALDIYPYLPDAHKSRARLFLAAGDTAAAIGEYERLIAKDDAQGETAIDLARLELARGDAAGAARALEYAVCVLPLEADVEALRGQAYLLDGRDREAFDLFTKARKLDLKSVESMAGMASYYLKRGDVEEATYFAELALKYAPHHAVARRVLAAAQAW
jgi:Flp pilus assembly protein TadD